MKHQGQTNRAARQILQRQLSVDVEDVERRRLYKADFALEIPFTDEQRRALNESALSRKEPVGRVLARVVEAPDPGSGKDIEVLTGWETLNAHIEENAYTRWAKVSLIDASDADAVFYAIQHAYEEAKIAGYPVTAIEYAEAVVRARQRFAESIPTVTDMAAALRIGRPTLANRLALLEKLCPHLINLARRGQLPETAAKAIASLPNEKQQIRYAKRYLRNPMPIAELYTLIQSGSPSKDPKAPKNNEESLPLHPGEQAFASSMADIFGVPVELTPLVDQAWRPQMRLRYASAQELASITAKLIQLMAGASNVQGEIVLTPRSVEQLMALTTPE
ncbi:MAG TPA: hypothetical protein DEG86_15810 [Halieaceae bacterium]|nr:hypothetical protein [Halieaceae bacterium]